MFGLTNETRVYVKTGVTDGRVGFEGLRSASMRAAVCGSAARLAAAMSRRRRIF